MKWPMIEIVVPNERWRDAPAGASCRFVRLAWSAGGHWGVKVYARLGHANRAAARQSMAHDLLLAPAVGPIVRVHVSGHATTRFGYLSQAVTCIGDACDDMEELLGRIERLGKRCKAAGIPSRDLNSRNIGFVPGMGWVPIDFDDLSSS